MGLTSFIIIAAISLFILIFMKQTNKHVKLDVDSFWEREKLANSTRKQPLDSLSYITIPLDSLPFTEISDNDKILECQNEIRALADKKIVNLTGISNTDLKLQYGVANLQTLTDYDQNFTLLARTLHTWGKELYSSNQIDAARTVLELSVSYKSDIKGCYLLLADIYSNNGEYDKIDSLIETVYSLNTMMKDSIISELKKKTLFYSAG